MKLFLLSLNLEDNWDVKNRYEGFPHKKNPSLRQLSDAFSEEWDHGMKEHERKVMINHIWEETLGNSLKQDASNEEINEDIPFEFKDLKNPTNAEMEIGFAPLNLSFR